jgi:TRAP-type mannitol/chloroaromatic compound transport system substrate-binding protein
MRSKGLSKHKWFAVIPLTLVLLLMITACGAPETTETPTTGPETTPEEVETFEWRLQASEPITSPWYDPTLIFLKDAVETMSEGRLKLTIYPTPEPVGPFDIFDAVSTGVIDAGSTTGGYYLGKVPALAFDSPSYSLRSQTEGQIYFYLKGGAEEMREIYEEHNIYYVGPAGTGTGTALWTNTPINTLDDLDGLKIRTYGLMGDHLELLGAEIVSLPGHEIYTALATGTIDGATFGNVNLAMDAHSLHEVAKYVMFPYIQGCYSGCFIVNMDSWNALPEDLQKIFEVACRAAYQINCWEEYDRDVAAINEAKTEWGVETTQLPDEDVARLTAAGMEALENFVAANKDKDAHVEPFLSILKDYMRELGYIE